MSLEKKIIFVMLTSILCGIGFGGGYILMGKDIESGKQFIYGHASYKCKMTNQLKEEADVSK